MASIQVTVLWLSLKRQWGFAAFRFEARAVFSGEIERGAVVDRRPVLRPWRACGGVRARRRFS